MDRKEEGAMKHIIIALALAAAAALGLWWLDNKPMDEQPCMGLAGAYAVGDSFYATNISALIEG